MHPYEQIAEQYRQLIRDGALAEGSRLPAIRDLATEHGVSTTTIRHALSWLQVEGYVRTSPRGTFVADEPPAVSSPHDRIGRLRRTGSILASGETKRVLAAGLVHPPNYVAELFGLEDGDQVCRREYVIGKGSRRQALAVDWYPATLAAAVGALLSTAPGRADDAVPLITEATGRTPRYGRDAMHARTADEREANYLGVAVGSCILAMAYEWSDDNGVIVYGEVCVPSRMDVGYHYSL
ncbi:GntR family transcriptional regulator [Streptomyces sp. JJ66]|uniref:GntR family transcriptional regulator n=1 Tax=Streptomyces sp. JJ66 TaxID=2803843 RepID=UPI001C55AE90|nr:GntR family transcriptional regulator [Streptomyces sp. JJ66]MBW1604216.1 GntR family transcriptional regulator [Streptomyces sp. JJ66]